MSNWKTTLFGLAAACGQVLATANIGGKWGNILSIAGISLMGLSAKDHNVTGGTVQQ